MLTRVVQRYAVAAVAFVVAAVVTGIGVAAAAECLGVFSAVYVVLAAYQARQLAVQRQRPARRRTRAVEDEWPQRAPIDWPSATWNG